MFCVSIICLKEFFVVEMHCDWHACAYCAVFVLWGVSRVGGCVTERKTVPTGMMRGHVVRWTLTLIYTHPVKYNQIWTLFKHLSFQCIYMFMCTRSNTCHRIWSNSSWQLCLWHRNVPLCTLTYNNVREHVLSTEQRYFLFLYIKNKSLTYQKFE